MADRETLGLISDCASSQNLRRSCGAVLCWQDEPLLYMEDAGRRNTVDKIAGYMYPHGILAGDAPTRRARGRRFLAPSGTECIVFDQRVEFLPEESLQHRRKATNNDT
jgi:hypothetical protein